MPVTYPKNEALRAAAGGAPRGRCMVETDSPYLSPRGCRGRRNEPALVVEGAAFIAARRGAAPSGSGRLSFRGPAVARLLDDIAAGRGHDRVRA